MDNRDRDKDPKAPDRGESPYGDHPFLGRDRVPFLEELLRAPRRSNVIPMTRPEGDAAREALRDATERAPHDPQLDYQPPNPMLVIPPLNATAKLVGAVAGLLAFALIAGLLFYHWMVPGPRHPGEKRQGQGLEQKIP